MSAMMMSVISWIPLRQISSDEYLKSHLAVLLICLLAPTKTQRGSLIFYGMWGGRVTIDEIATGIKELRKQGFMVAQ